MSNSCLFCRLVQGDIPSRKIFEDEEILAFHDIHPSAPVHFLVIPKIHRDSLSHCDSGDQLLLGKMLLLVPRLAQEQGLSGFKSIIHTGAEGGQEVFHLHIHVLGGAN
ncbi:MAG: HIT domain-containing protein [Ferrovum sp.]|jgi:histidine triad (HIT) family protein|nr:HIT domain-containing protein [Ferrovum sp.]